MQRITPTNKHTMRNCAHLAQFAAAAYDKDAIRRVAKAYGMGNPIIHDVSHHRTGTYRIAEFSNCDAAVIAYAGTDELADFFTTFKYGQREIPGGKVHSGLYEAGKLADIDVSRYGDRALFFVGHSLGGGQAQEKAQRTVHPLARCYTYGGMRVFSPGTEMEIKTTRCVLDIDLVPHLPPAFLPVSWLRYSHISDYEVFLNADGSYSYDRGIWDSLRDVGSAIVGDVLDFERGLAAALTPAIFEDHSSGRYAKVLGRGFLGREIF